MTRRAILVGALVSLALAAVLGAQHEEHGSPRATAPLTILQLNDVYSTTPVDDVEGRIIIARSPGRVPEPAFGRGRATRRSGTAAAD